MRVTWTAGSVLAVAGVVVTAGVIAYAYVKRKQLGEAVNPLSDRNAVYSAINQAVAGATGDAEATLGTKLWELFNAGAARADEAINAAVTDADIAAERARRQAAEAEAAAASARAAEAAAREREQASLWGAPTTWVDPTLLMPNGG